MKSLCKFLSEEKTNSLMSLCQFIFEEKTKPTKEWMKEHYTKYNKELFNNELPEHIELGLIGSHNGGNNFLGWQGFNKSFHVFKDHMKNGMYKMYTIPSNHRLGGIVVKSGRRCKVIPKIDEYCKEVTDITNLEPFIELNPRYEFSAYQMEDTMIHEMIHLWVQVNCLCPKQAHGKEFKRACDLIREKAKKLYGIEYRLTTYAKHENDEDKDYTIAKELQEKMKKEIKDAASKGGGVFSVYMIYDKSKMRNKTANDKKMLNYTHRFVFMSKNTIIKEKNDLKEEHASGGLIKAFISPTAYEEMWTKFGKFNTMRSFGRFWSIDDYEGAEEMLMRNAKQIIGDTTNESLSINEGVIDNIKSFVKKIMNNIGICISKDTPSSEINIEDMIEYADQEIDSIEDVKGDSKNDSKLIELES